MPSLKFFVLAGLFVIVAADVVPAAPPFVPPGPPPWVPRPRTVPIPATDLLFGIGVIALPWLRSWIKK